MRGRTLNENVSSARVRVKWVGALGRTCSSNGCEAAQDTCQRGKPIIRIRPYGGLRDLSA